MSGYEELFHDIAQYIRKYNVYYYNDLKVIPALLLFLIDKIRPPLIKSLLGSCQYEGSSMLGFQFRSANGKVFYFDIWNGRIQVPLWSFRYESEAVIENVQVFGLINLWEHRTTGRSIRFRVLGKRFDITESAGLCHRLDEEQPVFLTQIGVYTYRYDNGLYNRAQEEIRGKIEEWLPCYTFFLHVRNLAEENMAAFLQKIIVEGNFDETILDSNGSNAQQAYSYLYYGSVDVSDLIFKIWTLFELLNDEISHVQAMIAVKVLKTLSRRGSALLETEEAKKLFLLAKQYFERHIIWFLQANYVELASRDLKMLQELFVSCRNYYAATVLSFDVVAVFMSKHVEMIEQSINFGNVWHEISQIIYSFCEPTALVEIFRNWGEEFSSEYDIEKKKRLAKKLIFSFRQIMRTRKEILTEQKKKPLVSIYASKREEICDFLNQQLFIQKVALEHIIDDPTSFWELYGLGFDYLNSFLNSPPKLRIDLAELAHDSDFITNMMAVMLQILFIKPELVIDKFEARGYKLKLFLRLYLRYGRKSRLQSSLKRAFSFAERNFSNDVNLLGRINDFLSKVCWTRNIVLQDANIRFPALVLETLNLHEWLHKLRQILNNPQAMNHNTFAKVGRFLELLAELNFVQENTEDGEILAEIVTKILNFALNNRILLSKAEYNWLEYYFQILGANELHTIVVSTLQRAGELILADMWNPLLSSLAYIMALFDFFTKSNKGQIQKRFKEELERLIQIILYQIHEKSFIAIQHSGNPEYAINLHNQFIIYMTEFIITLDKRSWNLPHITALKIATFLLYAFSFLNLPVYEVNVTHPYILKLDSFDKFRTFLAEEDLSETWNILYQFVLEKMSPYNMCPLYRFISLVEYFTQGSVPAPSEKWVKKFLVFLTSLKTRNFYSTDAISFNFTVLVKLLKPHRNLYSTELFDEILQKMGICLTKLMIYHDHLQRQRQFVRDITYYEDFLVELKNLSAKGIVSFFEEFYQTISDFIERGYHNTVYVFIWFLREFQRLNFPHLSPLTFSFKVNFQLNEEDEVTLKDRRNFLQQIKDFFGIHWLAPKKATISYDTTDSGLRNFLEIRASNDRYIQITFDTMKNYELPFQVTEERRVSSPADEYACPICGPATTEDLKRSLPVKGNSTVSIVDNGMNMEKTYSLITIAENQDTVMFYNPSQVAFQVGIPKTVILQLVQVILEEFGDIQLLEKLTAVIHQTHFKNYPNGLKSTLEALIKLYTDNVTQSFVHNKHIDTRLFDLALNELLFVDSADFLHESGELRSQYEETISTNMETLADALSDSYSFFMKKKQKNLAVTVSTIATFTDIFEWLLSYLLTLKGQYAYQLLKKYFEFIEGLLINLLNSANIHEIHFENTEHGMKFALKLLWLHDLWHFYQWMVSSACSKRKRRRKTKKKIKSQKKCLFTEIFANKHPESMISIILPLLACNQRESYVDLFSFITSTKTKRKQYLTRKIKRSVKQFDYLQLLNMEIFKQNFQMYSSLSEEIENLQQVYEPFFKLYPKNEENNQQVVIRSYFEFILRKILADYRAVKESDTSSPAPTNITMHLKLLLTLFIFIKQAKQMGLTSFNDIHHYFKTSWIEFLTKYGKKLQSLYNQVKNVIDHKQAFLPWLQSFIEQLESTFSMIEQKYLPFTDESKIISAFQQLYTVFYRIFFKTAFKRRIRSYFASLRKDLRKIEQDIKNIEKKTLYFSLSDFLEQYNTLKRTIGDLTEWMNKIKNYEATINTTLKKLPPLPAKFPHTETIEEQIAAIFSHFQPLVETLTTIVSTLQSFNVSPIEKSKNILQSLKKVKISVNGGNLYHPFFIHTIKTVHALNQTIGVRTLCDILQGANTRPIRVYQLQTLQSYGVCSGLTKDVIKEYLSRLLNGYIYRYPEETLSGYDIWLLALENNAYYLAFYARPLPLTTYYEILLTKCQIDENRLFDEWHFCPKHLKLTFFEYLLKSKYHQENIPLLKRLYFSLTKKDQKKLRREILSKYWPKEKIDVFIQYQ